MVSNFRIVLAILSLYLAFGISYMLYVGWVVNNWSTEKFLKSLIRPPKHIVILNTIFKPLIIVRLIYFELIDSIEESEE